MGVGIGNPKPVVLVVDDNALVRRTLIRQLLPYFSVLTADSSAHAREILSSNLDIQVIISDCSMERTYSGTKLLQEISQTRPEVGRILVSGTLDVQQSTKLLDEGTAHAFFQKPWDRTELLDAINQFVRNFNKV